VEAHVSAVLRKLQLSSRHELTLWATNRKLIQASAHVSFTNFRRDSSEN
jgi:hypothetical protein